MLSIAKGGPEPDALRCERNRAMRVPTRGRAHSKREITRPPLDHRPWSPRRRATDPRSRKPRREVQQRLRRGAECSSASPQAMKCPAR
eukprot:19766-Pyramimonas_sp.AAC.1